MDKSNNHIICFIGPSGSGKTTSLELLVSELSQYRIGTLKFMHHPNFSINPMGKDTERHLKAGAIFTLSFAPRETAILIKKEERENLTDFKQYLNSKKLPQYDLIFVESLNTPPAEIPVILTASTIDELETHSANLSENQIIAISGPVSSDKDSWNGISTFNLHNQTELKELAKKCSDFVTGSD